MTPNEGSLRPSRTAAFTCGVAIRQLNTQLIPLNIPVTNTSLRSLVAFSSFTLIHEIAATAAQVTPVQHASAITTAM
jgi:hypothetical protein